MKKLLISAFVAAGVTFAVADAAVIRYGAGGARDRVMIANKSFLTPAGAPLLTSKGRSQLVDDNRFLDRFGRLDACALANGPASVCNYLISADIRSTTRLRSIKPIVGAQFNPSHFSFGDEREFRGDQRLLAFYIDGARLSIRGRFIAGLTGNSPPTLVTDGLTPTEFDQNGDATVPLPGSALLILTGLAAFGVASRRRRMRAI